MFKVFQNTLDMVNKTLFIYFLKNLIIIIKNINKLLIKGRIFSMFDKYIYIFYFLFIIIINIIKFMLRLLSENYEGYFLKL
jgi:hypothetical protein